MSAGAAQKFTGSATQVVDESEVENDTFRVRIDTGTGPYGH
jgi:hypothetical protein